MFARVYACVSSIGPFQDRVPAAAFDDRRDSPRREDLSCERGRKRVSPGNGASTDDDGRTGGQASERAARPFGRSSRALSRLRIVRRVIFHVNAQRERAGPARAFGTGGGGAIWQDYRPRATSRRNSSSGPTKGRNHRSSREGSRSNGR